MVTSLESPKSGNSNNNAVKFLCSYGGKILPRHPDGKLRYVGGETRVISVDRSITYSELSLKLTELCRFPVSLRCQLPEEDLDALVSITSDEDLANVIEDYDLSSQATGSPLKIRSFLWPPKQTKKVSPPSSATTSSSSKAGRYVYQGLANGGRRVVSPPTPVGYPVCFQKSSRQHYYTGIGIGSVAHAQRNPSRHLVHNGNHWQ